MLAYPSAGRATGGGYQYGQHGSPQSDERPKTTSRLPRANPVLASIPRWAAATASSAGPSPDISALNTPALAAVFAKRKNHILPPRQVGGWMAMHAARGAEIDGCRADAGSVGSSYEVETTALDGRAKDAGRVEESLERTTEECPRFQSVEIEDGESGTIERYESPQPEEDPALAMGQRARSPRKHPTLGHPHRRLRQSVVRHLRSALPGARSRIHEAQEPHCAAALDVHASEGCAPQSRGLAGDARSSWCGGRRVPR